MEEKVFGTEYGKYTKLIKDLIDMKGCEQVKVTDDELHCCCPFHDDTHASFGINLTTGAYNCFACNEKGSITNLVAKIKGITTQKAWKELQEDGYVIADDCNFCYTLEDYANEKHLDVEWLKKYFHLYTTENGNSIAIPYFDINSNLVRTRYRNNPQNEVRFYWDKDGKGTTLYGLWSINAFKNDYVILVEGESDCHTLLAYDVPCIGVPGAKNFKQEYAQYFERFDKIYIHSEEDAGAETFISGISGILPINKLYKISSKTLDSECKDVSDLHIKNKLDIKTLLGTAIPLGNANDIQLGEKNEKQQHVMIGEKLIDILKLKYYNNELYTYQNGVYKLATDTLLKNCIVREIDINAKKNLCNESIEFVRNWLSNDIEIDVNTNYINYLNGLYDISNNTLIPHTSDIFTVNQLKVNFLAQIPPNPMIDNYLDELMNHNTIRKKALLEIIGYCQTCKTDMQKSMIWYGYGSNGKSVLAKILIKIIGSENTAHVELQQFEKRFGAHEINQKLLNLVPELPYTKINDVATFKGVVTGDEIMADIKYKDRIKLKPYCKHIFTTNSLPEVADTTDGFYRRLNILLFEKKFDVNNNTFDITKYFEQTNIDYLANIGLRAYLELAKTSKPVFANEQESQEVLASYRQLNDTVLSFLTDSEVSYIYHRDMRSVDLWQRYKCYCVDNKFTPIKKHQFYKELQEKYNFQKKVINGFDHYYREQPVFTNNGHNNNISNQIKEITKF